MNPNIPAASHQASLRVRVARGVALPVLLCLLIVSLVHAWREWQLIETQLEASVHQIGDLTLNSLRGAMLVNDFDLVHQVLADVADTEEIKEIQIVNLNGDVIANHQPGPAVAAGSLGCQQCHQGTAVPARLAVVDLGENVLRVAAPINDEPACRGCHAGENLHLGVLLMDVSLQESKAQLLRGIQVDLLLALIGTLGVTGLVYWLVHRLVVGRIEAFGPSMRQLASGDFSARLSVSAGPRDEIGLLADGFNELVVDLERHAAEQQAQHHIRQQAVVEERERIARELHDGLAQLLGYVSTKAMAIRVLLQKQRYQTAEQNLTQLEEAAQELFIDVREAILGLRVNGTGQLVPALEAYAEQYARLSGIPVIVEVGPDLREHPLHLASETELQLMRIVQEALTNVRKHARASLAQIELQAASQHLVLSVMDDGVGFQPDSHRNSSGPQFGITIMQERANAIGAAFLITSQLGHGTRVQVQLSNVGNKAYNFRDTRFPNPSNGRSTQ